VNTADTPRQASRWRAAFEVGSTAAMLVLAAALVWQSRASLVGSPATTPSLLEAPIPKDLIQIDESTTLGASTARVAMIEFATFECSVCGEFASRIKPAVTREFIDNGLVRYMFKNFPMRVDTEGKAVAVAAWCASRQGRFWPMHDWLFSSPEHMKESQLQQPKTEVGLDVDAYQSCRSGSEATEAAQEARSRARALGIPATPTFYFGRVDTNGRVHVSETLVGIRPMEAFREILNRLLK
jgi:protein-disulfide isomerase